MGNVGALVPPATGEEVGLAVPAIVVPVGVGNSVLATLVTEDDGLGVVGRTVPTRIGLGVPTTGGSVVRDTVGDVVAVSGTGGGVIGCCGSYIRTNIQVREVEIYEYICLLSHT